MPDADNNPTAKLLHAGASIAGGAVLGAIGSVICSAEAGALLGAAGEIMHIVTDYSTRILSRNEQTRIGFVATLAIHYIRRRIETGEVPRDDDFFVSEQGDRSAAEEVFEGVLQSARSEHEERKIPCMARLFSSLAFSHNVSRGEANRLVRQLESLTYRKLCLLAVFSDKNRTGKLRHECLNSRSGSDELDGIMQDCIELEAAGLLCRRSYDQTPVWETGSRIHIDPSEIMITLLGDQLVQLAGLNQISTIELEPLVKLMS